MTEDEARSWIESRYAPECMEELTNFVALMLAANKSQNLISKASEAQIWTRHILDCAQLHRFAPEATSWLDVGSGAGLPGIVLGILARSPITLVEPRRKRAEFLEVVVEQLALPNVTVRQAEIERLAAQHFAAVTARAYAPLPDIFKSISRFANRSTVWILPKGRSAERELAGAQIAWQGVFHVEHSLTDADARIVVATDVRPR